MYACSCCQNVFFYTNENKSNLRATLAKILRNAELQNAQPTLDQADMKVRYDIKCTQI